ncbi:phospholipase A [uncultured Methylibium sp.]|uniref:phospholipase A n=1 Tax=uncultured Methylibium sp. TaxID=381093 RepID=UPI0025E442DF|nr:phospholipase A [uncultured Methylibium sp.]
MPSISRFLLPLLLGVALRPAAGAEADVSACLATADPMARLACYDRVHGRVDVPPAAARAAAAAAPTPDPLAVPPQTSVFDDRWDLDGRRRGELFVPRPYKPVYLLPATWTDRVNRTPSSPAPDHGVPFPLDLRSVEAKYQISFKSKLWEHVLGSPGTLWAGYTQSSRWQVYSSSVSRPFRETNYEPEIMFGWPLEAQLLGWRLRQASLSLNHQSNGRTLPLSRSWNRIVGELRFERGDWTAELRPWWRLREDASDDDNPDIEDYVGRAELLLTRQWGEHVVALQLRHSLRGGDRSRGSGQIEWAFPVDGALRGYLQWFSGYGESLIDYNLRQNKLGLGILIVGWR